MSDNQQWQCPHCQQHQIWDEANRTVRVIALDVGEADIGSPNFTIACYRCLNINCNKITLITKLEAEKRKSLSREVYYNKTNLRWTLIPEADSKPQPSYIPAPLIEDYKEACLIREKSPKSSATLARRCIQGMIRDFCGITRGRLIEEINELKRRVEEGNAPRGVQHETIEAIDAVREIGNIGAHMERDINLIIEVDPDEAQALIGLIEMLFKEWYVARHVREYQLAKIKKILTEKKDVKKALTSPPAPVPITDQSDGK